MAGWSICSSIDLRGGGLSLQINKLSNIKLLWIGARQEICYEDFIEIDVNDNLSKSQLLFIVVTSEKSIHKNKIVH